MGGGTPSDEPIDTGMKFIGKRLLEGAGIELKDISLFMPYAWVTVAHSGDTFGMFNWDGTMTAEGRASERPSRGNPTERTGNGIRLNRPRFREQAANEDRGTIKSVAAEQGDGVAAQESSEGIGGRRARRVLPLDEQQLPLQHLTVEIYRRQRAGG